MNNEPQILLPMFKMFCCFCANFPILDQWRWGFCFFRWLAYPWKCSKWLSTTRSPKGSNLSPWPPHVPPVSASPTTKTQLPDLKLTGRSFPTGGVISDNRTITWYVPRRVTPLVDAIVEMSDVQMGINGKLLDKHQMSERGYTLSGSDFYVVLEMPVGSPDGYYKVGCRLRIPNAWLWSLVHLHVLLKAAWIISEPCPRFPLPYHLLGGAHAGDVVEARWPSIQDFVSNNHQLDAIYPTPGW